MLLSAQWTARTRPPIGRNAGMEFRYCNDTKANKRCCSVIPLLNAHPDG
jgi:hypothetical protein